MTKNSLERFDISIVMSDPQYQRIEGSFSADLSGITKITINHKK
jgi:hypothetical protein